MKVISQILIKFSKKFTNAKTFFSKNLGRCDTQQNDTQHNGTQHKNATL
jgi:hypothetical protein